MTAKSEREGADLNAYIRELVDSAPPLSISQQSRIAALFRNPGDLASVAPPPVPAHYDEAGRLLFVGNASTDILRHVELKYARRTERIPAEDAHTAARNAIFFHMGAAALAYLVEHEDYDWIMPVEHMDNNANPLPQVKPWKQQQL